MRIRFQNHGQARRGLPGSDNGAASLHNQHKEKLEIQHVLGRGSLSWNTSLRDQTLHKWTQSSIFSRQYFEAASRGRLQLARVKQISPGKHVCAETHWHLRLDNRWRD
jgi:hypothetical protein